MVQETIRTDPSPRPAHRHVIDVLRAVAALSVCIYHFAGTLAAAGDVSPAVARVTSLGWLGVPVFFVISGFVIPLSMGDWRLNLNSCRTFLGRRFLRLYPPYLMASLSAVGLWWLSSLTPGFRGTVPTVTGWQVLASATMTADFVGAPWLLVVAWTLAIEVQFYLAITLLLPLLLNHGRGMCVMALMTWLALPLVYGDPALVSHHTPLFGMGILVYLALKRQIGQHALVALLLGAGAVQGFTGGWEPSLAGIATAAALMTKPGYSRLAAYLGAVSYSLYLIHVPIGGRLINLGLRLPDFPYRGVVVMTAALAGSLLAADIFYRLIEQRWIDRSRAFGRTFLPVSKNAELAPIEEVQTA